MEEEERQEIKIYGSGGIRTHASEETGALNQRLRPLGHATVLEIRGTLSLLIHNARKPAARIVCITDFRVFLSNKDTHCT